MMRLALLPVVFLFLLPGYTYAQFSSRDAGVLKGIGPIRVVVEGLSSDFKSYGLRTDGIQRDVELKLRLAGIPFDEEKYGYLYVVVGGVCETGGVCAYSARVSYKEVVYVYRGDELIDVSGVSVWWSPGVVGTVSRKELRSAVRDGVKDRVDDFVNAYFTANPKQ